MSKQLLLDKLANDLTNLSAERAALASEFKEAADLGDLPENSFYDEVKFRSLILDSKIDTIKDLTKKIIVQNAVFGNLTNITRGWTKQICILDGFAEELDNVTYLSPHSPLGQAILSSKPNKEFSLLSLAGEQVYTWELV